MALAGPPCSSRRPPAIAVLAGCLLIGAPLAGCSTRAADITAPVRTTIPPVTSAPLARTTTVPLDTTSTTEPPTSFSLLVEPSVQPVETSEPPVVDASEPGPIEVLSAEMLALLGPVTDLVATLDSLAVFPPGVATPTGAELIDVSVGVGTPGADGQVDAQVAATMATPVPVPEAADQVVRSLVDSGYTVVESAETDEQRSASFRVPGGQRFDELTVAVVASASATLVRLAYSAPAPTSRLQRFIEWSGTPLPLPERTDRRSLVVATRSGTGSLESARWSAETAAVVDRGDLQQEADRLVERLAAENDVWTTTVDTGTGPAPLTGPLTHPDLDNARYEVVPVQRVGIDRSREVESVPGVEVRVLGERTEP